MQVIHRIGGYKQDPTRYFHLEDYASSCGDFILIEGGFGKPLYWDEYKLTLREKKKIFSKKIVRLEFEEPNKFFAGDYPYSYDKDFYRIFTICPYTADWLNKKYRTNKRTPVFFPVSERYLPKRYKKIIDVIYSGHIVSQPIKQIVQSMIRFNYALISNSKDRLVTHRGVSYEKKMELMAQSKITLVHNVMFRQNPYFVFNVWRCGDYWNNVAFKDIPKLSKPWELVQKTEYNIPQLKSRLFEAAFCRSLILCREDEFKLTELFFEPQKEFIYYKPKHLERTIKRILEHYEDYEEIVERAYKRAIKDYTVKAFVNKYLKHLN